jgi:ABC-2 type transport system permease protein
VSATTYVRYELLRTFRNKRFMIFSLGFPLALYYLIAAPTRNVSDLNGSASRPRSTSCAASPPSGR